MTDMKLTPERIKELRERAQRTLDNIDDYEEPELWLFYTDLLSLLDQHKPAPDDAERAKMLTRLAVMNDHYKDTMFHGDWPVLGVQVHNAEVEKIRSLILSAPAPRKVACPECGEEISHVTCPECKLWFGLAIAPSAEDKSKP